LTWLPPRIISVFAMFVRMFVPGLTAIDANGDATGTDRKDLS
jgi:hypothetical protein